MRGRNIGRYIHFPFYSCVKFFKIKKKTLIKFYNSIIVVTGTYENQELKPPTEKR